MATCEERIDARLENAMGHLHEALRDDNEKMYALKCEECGHKWQSEEEFDDCPECDSPDVLADLVDQEERETRDSYMEGVLEITPLHIVYRVGLSWGGPADGFWLYVDPEDHTIDKVEYYFQDWFDGAERVLTGNEFDMVCSMFEPYIESAEYERTHK